jgi:hypothetical protein
MARVVIALGLLAAGCGGPNWKGIFSGTETDAQTCSDGSTASASQAAGLDIGTDSNGIFWPIECGIVLHAAIQGNTATILPATCMPVTLNGVTSTAQITGGTLTIDGDTINETLNAAITIQGSTVTCADTDTGTFGRESD